MTNPLPPQDDNPLYAWEDKHQPDAQTRVEISRWIDAMNHATYSVRGSEKLAAWFGNPSEDAPDVVACIANYGWARIAIRGWKKLPIDIPKDERERWRKEYATTIEELWEYLAGAAGGFLEAAGHNPGEVIRLIRAQATQKTARMEELANESLDYYTPDTYDEMQVLEGWFDDERRAIREVFDLREQLHCFELGMEYMRMFCFEEAPELGLPNKGLYAALGDYDLNLLIGKFDAVDGKLKRILGHLQKHNAGIEDETAPDAFWWRHYKPRTHQGKPTRA